MCRSPLAEALLRHHLRQAGESRRVKVSSAGTRVSHPGAKPDQRAFRVAAEAGVSLGRIRTSRVTEEDMERSDLVLAMDAANVRDLLDMCPSEHAHKIGLLLSYHPQQGLEEVPDPYYGAREGFVQVFEMIHEAVLQLAAELIAD